MGVVYFILLFSCVGCRSDKGVYMEKKGEIMRSDLTKRQFLKKNLLIGLWLVLSGLGGSEIIQAKLKTIDNKTLSALAKYTDNLDKDITKYQKTNKLSSEDQAYYIQDLRSFQDEVAQLEDKGFDVSEIQQDYLNEYLDWAAVMVTDTKLLKQVDQPSKSVSSGSFAKQRTKQIEKLYNNMNDALNKAQDAFVDNVSAQIDAVEKDAAITPDNFGDFLQKAHNAFAGSVRAAQTVAKGDFFAFLESKNQLPEDSRQLDQQERDFLKGVDAIAQDAMVCMRALMLDMTSATIKSNFAVVLNQAFATSDLQAQKAYEKQLKDNKKGLKRSWFTELKLSGKDLLKDFSKEFKKEAAKQVQAAIKKQGGKLANEIGENVSDFFQDGAGAEITDKIKELTADLSLESVADFLGASDTKRMALKIAIRMKEPVTEPTGPVKVDTGVNLCPEEKTFLRNRMGKATAVLYDEFGIEEPLSVAFCLGAGGTRASIGALGILTAAARAKLLQASTYIAAASGSTWIVTAWASAYLKGLLNKDLTQSLIELRKNWEKVLDNPEMMDTPVGFMPELLNDEAASVFANQMAVRLGYGNSVSLVDLYGAMVANMLLDVLDEDPATETDRFKVTWSSLSSEAQQGLIPLPLCASIFEVEQPKKSSMLYEWFESGPFQAGSTQLGYIPVQYLGSDFKAGELDFGINPSEDVSADFTEAFKKAAKEASDTKLRPEYPLSFFQGVYGAVFGANIHDVVNHLLPNPKFSIGGNDVVVPVGDWMKDIIESEMSTTTAKKRSIVGQAEFMNFSLDVATSALNNKATFGLIDPTFAFAFPLPLLTDRRLSNGTPVRPVNVIIMYDSTPGDTKSFEDISAYYKRKEMKNLPDFSKVKAADLKTKVMTVFNDPRKEKEYDASAPTIIYFPTRSKMIVPASNSSKVKKDEGKDEVDATSSKSTSANKKAVVDDEEQETPAVKSSDASDDDSTDDTPKRPTQFSKAGKKAKPMDAGMKQISFDVTKMPYKSANFKYTSEEMGNLVDAMDYAFTSQLSEIKAIMKAVAMKNRQVA